MEAFGFPNGMRGQIHTKNERIFLGRVVALAPPDLTEAQAAIQRGGRDVVLGNLKKHGSGALALRMADGCKHQCSTGTFAPRLGRYGDGQNLSLIVSHPRHDETVRRMKCCCTSGFQQITQGLFAPTIFETRGVKARERGEIGIGADRLNDHALAAGSLASGARR